MKKIDQETVQRILDAADIVEVVSDFVTLKRRGANYIGLCPFHNERTPSFSVSRAKGICKCFSCGKGGSAVGFIMEHEQMSYTEALRYLARKYHIEIKEHEMSDQEREAETERESMLALNDFAAEYFAHNLMDTETGRAIGLSYFRERGINDQMIKRFRLGYAIDKYDAFIKAATAKGYDVKYMLATGLCARSDKTGNLYDKYKGRVIYPIFSVSGRIIGFGGRILTSNKDIAKYINSPQSSIYDKSRELYGLYQAKSAISRKEKCILVEGYMDVISMHQAGIENVVASSGTSLTEGQIRLIHRFTNNVTVIYDSDAAGIKASFRGIDMLLAEGLNVKVLLLPTGDDPDSFAQSHSAAEVEAYLAENEVDFIRFKTRIKLKDAKDDPLARAAVINDIIESIAVIPDPIVRNEYIKECSRMLEVADTVLTLQVKKRIADKLQTAKNPAVQQQNDTAQLQEIKEATEQSAVATINSVTPSAKMAKYEQELMKYVVRYGMAQLWEDETEAISVLDYICGELEDDGIVMSSDIMRRILDIAKTIKAERWSTDLEAQKRVLTEKFNKAVSEGREVIRNEAVDLADIQARERKLTEECSETYARDLDDYAIGYLESILISSPDDAIRSTATNLAYEPYTLSKVHTRYAHVETERERLSELVPRAVVELKLGILNERIAQIQAQLKAHAPGCDIIGLMSEQKRLFDIRSEFSRFLGERIVTPR